MNITLKKLRHTQYSTLHSVDRPLSPIHMEALQLTTQWTIYKALTISTLTHYH